MLHYIIGVILFGIFRFTLALNVMIFHVMAIKVIGPYAVYSFFILSGFLMTTIMKNTYGYTVSGFKSYAYNRLLRIFPICCGQAYPNTFLANSSAFAGDMPSLN
jgi:peptidoglycan/LPS O-acetylase OafA/YrhL